MGVDAELEKIARSLVWWKPPGEVEFYFLVRRVMNDGTMTMQRLLAARDGEDVFRRALARAEPGDLSERAWRYWHLRLGIEPVPPPPVRIAPSSPYVAAEIVRTSTRPAVALATP